MLTEHILCTDNYYYFELSFVFTLFVSPVYCAFKLYIKPAFSVFGFLLLPHVILFTLLQLRGYKPRSVTRLLNMGSATTDYQAQKGKVEN